MIVEGFQNTPLISNGCLDPNGPYDSILFKAKSLKLPNGPILSIGSNMFFQQTDIEYWLLEVKGYLNYTSVHNDEGVESDFLYCCKSYRTAELSQQWGRVGMCKLDILWW